MDLCNEWNLWRIAIINGNLLLQRTMHITMNLLSSYYFEGKITLTSATDKKWNYNRTRNFLLPNSFCKIPVSEAPVLQLVLHICKSTRTSASYVNLTAGVSWQGMILLAWIACKPKTCMKDHFDTKLWQNEIQALPKCKNYFEKRTCKKGNRAYFRQTRCTVEISDKKRLNPRYVLEYAIKEKATYVCLYVHICHNNHISKTFKS